MRVVYSLVLAGLCLVALPATAQITVENNGNWGDPATWSTGTVPTATDDVVIADSNVVINIPDAVAHDITITGNGTLRTDRGYATNTPVGLTVFGNLTLQGAGASFLPLSNQDPDTGIGFGAINHRLTLRGNLDNSTGGTFDTRRGATSTTPQSAAFIDVVFAGDQNSTVTLGPYDNDRNQLFKVEIAKEAGARVILGSDVMSDNNSLATLTLTSGYLQTNQYRYTLISSNSSVVVGGSPASYVMGELARGFSKGTPSSQYNRTYPIGDEDAYRPARLFATARASGDQFMGLRVVSGDADTGSSTFAGGLTDVSPNRYYAATWYFFGSSDPMTLDRIEPTYGADDNVPEGSTQFVVASSTDSRATWTNAGGFDTDGTTPHTTTLASPPTAIQSGDLIGWTFTFSIVGTEITNTTHYAAIGTTGTFTAASAAPSAAALVLGTAPNPAASTAAVTFTLPRAADVTVGLYDVLGRRVATVVDGALASGDHTVPVDVSRLAAGVYAVRIQAGADAAVRMLTVSR